MSTAQSRLGTAEVTIVDDTSFEIVRRFDAPAARVFEVWTRPEHVRRWWTDDSSPLTECTIDLRVGGRWRYALAGPDGTTLAWHGVYREIVAGSRLVSTEVFEPFPDAEAVNTLTLVEQDGVTTLTAVVRHRTKEARDGHLESGMEAGLQLALDRVDRLLTEARD
jgi:uncharacterized protein YndB with AHSA1/START domain